MDSPPRGFRSFVPRYYATSRNFRQQNAVKRGCKSLLSGEGLGKGRAVYGRLRPILEGGFRRAAEIPAFGPKTALSGPNAPRRPLDGGGAGGRRDGQPGQQQGGILRGTEARRARRGPTTRPWPSGGPGEDGDLRHASSAARLAPAEIPPTGQATVCY